MDCLYFVKSDNRNNESDISVKTSSIGNGDNYEKKLCSKLYLKNSP